MEDFQIDLAKFLGALINELGGEARIPFDSWSKIGEDKSISIDVEDDGATLVLRLIDTKDIPDE